MTPQDRMLELMAKKNVRPADLARELNKSAAAISKWLSGASVPSSENLMGIAKYLESTPQYILYGDTSGRNDSNGTGNNKNFDGNVIRVNNKLLPVLSWIQAGQWTDVNSVEKMDIKQWMPALSADDCNECFYLEVKGISNEPAYIEGDFILVDPCVYVGDLISGDLIAVQNEDGETFKQLIIESNGRRYLRALNPQWQPNIIEFTEGTKLIGLIVDALRPLGGSRRNRIRKKR